MSRKKNRRTTSKRSKNLSQPAPVVDLAPPAATTPEVQPYSLPGNQVSMANAEPPEVLAFVPDAYQITLHREKDRKHDDLVVTFAGQPGEMAASGFGTSFVLSQGFDTIYVAQKHETHFQKLSREDFAAAIGPIAKDRRVVFYGSSLGAYAALYYAGTLNAEVIAGAPMLPPWPSLSNPRYKGFELSHGPIKDAPVSDKRITILFDPHLKVDNKFLDEAIRPAYPDADYVEVPYGGHTVLRTLQSAGLLGPVVQALLEGRDCPPISLPTEGFSPWHLNYGGARLAEGDAVEAERHGRAAFAVEPTAMAVSMVVRALTMSKQSTALKAFLTQELTPELTDRFVLRVPALVRIVNGFDPDLLQDCGLQPADA